MKKRMDKMKRMYKAYYLEFESIFNIPLNKFFDNIFGLDIVEFDTWLNTPDGTSTSDYIINTYGIEANQIIKELL